MLVFFCIISGAQFDLQNSGEGTCATPFDNGFVTIGGLGHGKVDRCSIHNCHHTSFCPRYDSEGKYLDSLPDLATPRRSHACTTFTSENNEEVKISTSCPIICFLCFKQTLLVVGGYHNYLVELSSTEIFSNGRWTTGENLPR